MRENFKCLVCDGGPDFAWTDHHGIAQHVPCGTAYRLIHYEGDGDGYGTVLRRARRRP